MKVEVICLILLFYVYYSKPLFAKVRDHFNIKSEGKLFRLFMLLHNLALCLFSLWVTINTWPLLVNYTKIHGYKALLVDKDFWISFEYWAIVFYVSKFYEFFDSWILVLKGKDPSYLQVYHHFGVVVAMWLACKNHSNWLIFMVALNSFIHTLMYFYYVFSSLGHKSELASSLTKMQLAQFVTGILLSSPTYILDEATWENKLSMAFMHSYAIGLIFLFYQMFLEKYKEKQENKKK